MIVEPIEIEPADITEEERALLSKTPKQLEENEMKNMDQKPQFRFWIPDFYGKREIDHVISTLKENFGATNIIVEDEFITSDIPEESRDWILKELTERGLTDNIESETP